jgi:hypothetical protein
VIFINSFNYNFDDIISNFIKYLWQYLTRHLYTYTSEFGSTFRIEGLYNLKSKKCCSWPSTQSDVEPHNIQSNLEEWDFWRCGICVNYCKLTATCKQKKYLY